MNKPLIHSASPWLSLTGLTAHIGTECILNNIDLQIAQGESVALVGGSGAGKSTLLRCLMGFRHPVIPVSGQLRVADEYIDYAKAKAVFPQTRYFSYVPQNPKYGLDPLRKLAWQWKQALRCAQNSTRSAAETQAILSAFSLKDFAADYPHQWSLGMQQRLLLAFALLSKPQLLILDEPTSALDVLVGAQVITEVMTYAKANNISVLMVTHDLAMAANFSQQIVILEQGIVVEAGPSKTLIETPQSQYAQHLMAQRFWQRESIHANR